MRICGRPKLWTMSEPSHRRTFAPYNSAMSFSNSKGAAMATRVVLGVFMAALTLAVAACGGDAPPPESQSQTPSAAPAADASHTQHAGGRVFFVAPKNGDTIKTLSK